MPNGVRVGFGVGQVVEDVDELSIEKHVEPYHKYDEVEIFHGGRWGRAILTSISKTTN